MMSNLKTKLWIAGATVISLTLAGGYVFLKEDTSRVAQLLNSHLVELNGPDDLVQSTKFINIDCKRVPRTQYYGIEQDAYYCEYDSEFTVNAFGEKRVTIRRYSAVADFDPRRRTASFPYIFTPVEAIDT